MNLFSKVIANLQIYKKDLKTKGIYWSIVHRLYKVPSLKKQLVPIVNKLKPDFVIAQNHKIYIDKKDSIVSEVLLSEKIWEPYETKIIKRKIKKGDIVVDIGAHIGYYTLIAASIVGDKGKVYAFEPDPSNFHLLKKNINVNGYTNVVTVNKAVSNKNGNKRLYLNDENRGDHRVFDSGDKRKSIAIAVVTLDDFFKDKKETIDFMKMDIQGSEVFAMKGARKIVDKSKKIKFITEFMPFELDQSGSSAEEYLRLLKNNKFKIYRLDEVREKLIPINPEKLLRLYNDNKHYLTNLLCYR
ncbi:MAG TPA: FkbM family methyltransferase [Candidatus Acidoferrales bacterium]|nr:FkbM family methyltransferase [Candidatus Acidoferrales bacterium]